MKLCILQDKNWNMSGESSWRISALKKARENIFFVWKRRKQNSFQVSAVRKLQDGKLILLTKFGFELLSSFSNYFLDFNSFRKNYIFWTWNLPPSIVTTRQKKFLGHITTLRKRQKFYFYFSQASPKSSVNNSCESFREPRYSICIAAGERTDDKSLQCRYRTPTRLLRTKINMVKPFVWQPPFLKRQSSFSFVHDIFALIASIFRSLLFKGPPSPWLPA